MHEIYLVSSVHISLPIPLNEVGAEWDVNRRDTASHEIDGMNETRSGEMNDVWLASLHLSPRLSHSSSPFAPQGSRVERVR